MGTDSGLILSTLGKGSTRTWEGGLSAVVAGDRSTMSPIIKLLVRGFSSGFAEASLRRLENSDCFLTTRIVRLIV